MEMLNVLLTGGGIVFAAGVGNAIYESVADIKVDPKTGFKYRNGDKVYVGMKSRRAGVSGEKLGKRPSSPPARKGASSRGGNTLASINSSGRPVGAPVQHGKAGGAIGGNTKFSSYATAAGAKGEAILGQTMIAFFKKHNVPAHIYHGVYYPGSREADIDHVIVVGQAVYLVDAKLYKADTYWLDKNSTVIASLRHGEKRSAMATAYYKTKEALGSRGIVRGVRICIVSVGREETRVRRSGGIVDVCTPPQLLQEILKDISSGDGMRLANKDGSKLRRFYQGQLK